MRVAIALYKMAKLASKRQNSRRDPHLKFVARWARQGDHAMAFAKRHRGDPLVTSATVANVGVAPPRADVALPQHMVPRNLTSRKGM